MDLNRLTRDADDLIRKVVSRYNQLYVPAGTISQLELDLMLDDLRKLYDTFKNIGHINLTHQNSHVKPEVTVNVAVPPDTQPNISTTPDVTLEQVHSVDTDPIPPLFDSEPEPVKETKPEITPEPEPEIIMAKEKEIASIPEPKTEPESAFDNQVLASAEISDIGKVVQEPSDNSEPVNHDVTTAMLADKFNTSNKSLSETLASSQAKDVMGSRILFQPIADLITGIGLNDKFSFISDLFGNNASKYDEAITRINKAVNLDEANWILHKYHTTDWEQKPESLARLKDFIKRRFI
jgi:hypothetical protein